MSEAPVPSPPAPPRPAPARAPSLAGRAVLAAALLVGFYVLALGMSAGLLAVVWFLAAEFERVPLQIALPCIVGSLAILWSILPRFDRFRPPGPELLPDVHPRLFEHLRRISRATQQRMPRNVYLVPDVNAWVAERGGILGLGRRRVMGLGLPLLSVLSTTELEAVVAHEFGHFHGGDTALGPWVYRTRAAIGRTITNLRGGRTRILQGPFIAYGNFFLRLTHSVSRSQELAADALAANLVGGDALGRGLVKIGKASLAYDPFLRQELAPVLGSGVRPPIVLGFQRFLAAESVAGSLDKAIEARRANEKQNPLDTHPTLRERLAALERFPPGKSSEGEQPAIALLERTDSLEIELLRGMLSKLDPSKLESIAWSETVERVYLPAWEKERRSAAAELRGKRVVDLAADLAPRPGAPPAWGTEETRKRLLKLGAALVLAVRSQGWSVESAVGEEVALVRGDRRFHPFRDLAEIVQGKLDPEAWRERCRRDGIDAVELSVPE